MDKFPDFPDLPLSKKPPKQSHKRRTSGGQEGQGQRQHPHPCCHHGIPIPGGFWRLWSRGLGSAGSAPAPELPALLPAVIHPNPAPRPPAVKPRHIRRIPGIAAEPHTCRSGLGRCQRRDPGAARGFMDARHHPKSRDGGAGSGSARVTQRTLSPWAARHLPERPGCRQLGGCDRGKFSFF